MADGPDQFVFGPIVDLFDEYRPGSLPADVGPDVLRDVSSVRYAFDGIDYGASFFGGLWAASAAVDMRARIAVSDTWLEPPIIWLNLIGPPSVGKSPALRFAAAPLRKLQRSMREDFEREMKDHKMELVAWEKGDKGNRGQEPLPPVEPVLLVDHTTTEALARDAKANPAGFGLINDELVGFLRGMDAYRSGARIDQAFYLSSYGAAPYSHRRKSTESLDIPSLGIAVAGGIQTEVIAEYAENLADDGLLARFIPVFMAPKEAGKRKITPAGRHAIDGYDRMIRSIRVHVNPVLADRNFAPIGLKDEAQEALWGWHEDLTAAQPTVETIVGAKASAALGKLAGMTARLALLLHIVSYADTEGRVALGEAVSFATVFEAITIVQSALLPNLIAFNTSLSGGHGRNITREAAAAILVLEEDVFTIGSLRRVMNASRKSIAAHDLHLPLQTLESMNWIAPVESDAVGRTRRWVRNGKLTGAMSEKRASELARRRAATLALNKLRGRA